MWHKRLWLIDHGAALYFHHGWTDMAQRAKDPFPLVKQHILLQSANDIETADQEMKSTLTDTAIRGIVELVPDEWMDGGSPFPNVLEMKEAYVEYLLRRLDERRYFVEEALRARSVQV
jgi:hypothetical protein